MNERIRQLAEQANELDYETFDEYNHKTVKHYKFNKEKFAQLIVRECAQDFDNTYMQGGKTMGAYIREKFGVEQ